jgi:hypothetical protein
MAELPHTLVHRVAHARAKSEMFRPYRIGVDGLAKALTADDADALAADEPKPTHLPIICPECPFLGPPVAVERHMDRTGHGPERPERDDTNNYAHGGDRDSLNKADLGMALTKAAPERRYALGVLYMPNKLDAHREWSTADDLHQALWDFARHGDKKLRKQHGDEVIGEVVEAFVWPFDHDADLIQADGSLRKAELPAGTAYIGAIFTPQGWAEVKDGRRTGFSMGGSTVRLKEALPS